MRRSKICIIAREKAIEKACVPRQLKANFKTEMCDGCIVLKRIIRRKNENKF